jgi:hypothetical protein
MAKKKDVIKAFERLKAMLNMSDLQLIWNSAWRSYNIERPFDINDPTRESHPFGLPLLTGDQIIAGVRFIEGYKTAGGK